MKFEFHNIGESKSALRKELAARPIAEKLRMLDALRERTLSIRRASKSGPARKDVAHQEYDAGKWKRGDRAVARGR